MAAPGFVIFEAWAQVLLKSRDFLTTLHPSSISTAQPIPDVYPSLLRRWSSFRHYAFDEPESALVNQFQKPELRIRKIS